MKNKEFVRRSIPRLTFHSSFALRVGFTSFIWFGSAIAIIVPPWTEVAQASAITSDLDFAVEGKSIWSTGNAFFFRKADFIGIQWDKTFSDTYSFPLGAGGILRWDNFWR